VFLRAFVISCIYIFVFKMDSPLGRRDHTILIDYESKYDKILEKYGTILITGVKELISGPLYGEFKVCYRGIITTLDKDVKGEGYRAIKYINTQGKYFEDHKPEVINMLKSEVRTQKIASVIFERYKDALTLIGHYIKINVFAPILYKDPKLMYDGVPIEAQGEHILVEHWLGGDYVKLINQVGKGVNEVHVNYKYAAAFVHYSFVLTNGNLLFADIQGTASQFTDMTIHTKSSEFSILDCGEDGIDSCRAYHKCNEICQLLNLGNEEKVYKLNKEKIGTQLVLYTGLKLEDEYEVQFHRVLLNSRIRNLMDSEHRRLSFKMLKHSQSNTY
jgi:hypothetical protein